MPLKPKTAARMAEDARKLKPYFVGEVSKYVDSPNLTTTRDALKKLGIVPTACGARTVYMLTSADIDKIRDAIKNNKGS